MHQVDPIVATAAGRYRGRHRDGVDVYLGIRYGAPPVGDRRWRRAVPTEPHEGVADALRPGPVCPQHHDPTIRLGPDAHMDEDCLFLNVFAPTGRAASGAAGLPVMVWLHGGAYVFGSGSQPLYDGTGLAAAGDVLVVTLNYRLGAFGFADFGSVVEAAAPEGSDVDSGRFDSNNALSDVLLALRWVADDIAGFGGDPANVTVFGESAGAALVTTLLTMPAAQGLFHRAIAQSSPATSVYDRHRAATVSDALLASLGVAPSEPQRIVAANTEDVVTATMRAYEQVPREHPGIIPFAPVVDGDLVPCHPLDSYRAGTSLPVPLLIGTNRDEASVFKLMRSPIMPITPEAIRTMFATIAAETPGTELPPEEQVTQAYPGLDAGEIGLGVARDVAFRMPTLWLAEAHSRRAPVHLYRFDFAPTLLRLLRIGAGHATELPYIWGTLPTTLRRVLFAFGGARSARRLRRSVQQRWTQYAATGTPDADGPDWPAFDVTRRATLLIGDPERVVDDPDRELRHAWGDDVLGFR